MSQVSSEITINKPISEVFAYMASPHNGPAFIPNLNENTNIFPEDDGLGQKFDWRFNIAGVDLRGKAEVTEHLPPTKVVITSEGDASSVWTYSLENVDGGTKVSVEVAYEFSETAIQRMTNRAVVDKLTQKTTEQMLENLKIILES